MIIVESPIVAGALVVSFILVLAALALAVLRLIKGPTMADRVVALDLVTIISVGFMALFSLAAHQDAFLDVAITLALVGFLGTVAFARYAERRAAKGASHQDLDD
ncbi:monovalent cation/H+ antiporter complex subunit F [Fodinicurvata sp. EGI_FJ10296]|jgi:multicomponent Na+:H+ antiporter subunit F|uniref:monovalent cation/H+ antiporter complex subunit F n=1 Tax=Fodinicurvata sp. EGI_FJ10296 TaxID=3231908 RepID=UPI0034511B3D